MFSSMVVDRWPAVTVIVPLAVAVPTGFSLKESFFGLGDAD